MQYNETDVQAFFNRIGSFLYRAPKEGEAMRLGSGRRLRWAFFCLLSLGLILPLGITLVGSISRWTGFRVAVELPKAQWRAVYEAGASCGPSAAGDPGCLASPDDPRLWTSAYPRDDQDAHKARVLARPGQEYWIGTTISAEQARAAFEHEANFLVVGNVGGTFRVWIEGLQMLSGQWLDSDPLVVAMPLQWLKEGRPVHVAIRCLRTTDLNDAPDELEGAGRLGLVTKSDATEWQRHWHFWVGTRPLVLIALNVLLAWVFFGVWSVAPEKAEYFYIAVLAICFGFFNLRRLDLIFLTDHRTLLNTVFLPIAVLHAFATMLAGFAFARLRGAIMLASALACGLACVLSLALMRNTVHAQVITYGWLTTGADLGAVLGAAACFLQSLCLWYNPNDRFNLAQRIRRLVAFGSGLVVLAALNHVWGADLVNSMHPTVLNILVEKSGPFFLLLTLGVTALSEFRSEHALAQAMPVSRYHRLDPLPDAVPGFLLSVDLKDSEKLSRQSARLGRGGDLVETCLSHLWSAVSEGHGLVLQTEGDSLRALFPVEEQADALAAALAATRAMQRNLDELERRFISQGMAGAVGGRFRFRASLVEGAIRPIWQAYGGTRLAGWVEAGHSNAFIEASRLLELERDLAREVRGPASLIVVPATLRSKLAVRDHGLEGGRWLVERRTVAGKHGQSYDVSVFAVETSH